MIEGVGIDIVDVKRMAEKISDGRDFKTHVFSAGEISYCDKQQNRAEYYAARFAAKEAFFKALGTGWAEGTSFNEIEIIHEESGKPEINLLGETRKKLVSLLSNKISVSLSHIESMATAIVIIEK